MSDPHTLLREVAPGCDWWSLRVHEGQGQHLQVRNDVPEPPRLHRDLGALLRVRIGAGEGYAATSDLSRSGLAAAAGRAADWARATAGLALVDARSLPRPEGTLSWQAPVAQPWQEASPADLLARLGEACRRLGDDAALVNREASLSTLAGTTTLSTSDGVRIAQRTSLVVPGLAATAHRAGLSQTRSLGFAQARSGGLELLAGADAFARAEAIGQEALQLLAAPDCPSGTMPLVLLPGQMALQIHESIGHPLELDRILGDERNYAGGSFVTPAMFGTYRYGSELLSVSFDPGVPGEAAGYACDDDGTPARRELLIDRGLLVRPLGGATSQARSGLSGVANARACAWNRAPIDRMANLNLEPGGESLAQLIAGVELGVLMDTTRCWSIDDQRDQFQFGCEWGRMIRDGRLAEVVRNANYRGRSADFWRSLAGLGDASTRQVLGVTNCGKGEPNQAITVGHAAPACRFDNVAVFGGAA